MKESLQEIALYYKNQGAPSDQSALLSCLREAQQACGGMLDAAAQQEIGAVLRVKPTYLQAVAKRISDLKLSGASHTLTVCQGVNCSREGKSIHRYLEDELGAKPGKTFWVENGCIRRLAASVHAAQRLTSAWMASL